MRIAACRERESRRLHRSRDAASRLTLVLRRHRYFAHIKFENAPDHDKFPRAVAVLRAHEAERLIAVDEKSAADTARRNESLERPSFHGCRAQLETTALGLVLADLAFASSTEVLLLLVVALESPAVEISIFLHAFVSLHSGDRSSSIFEAIR